MPPQKAAIFSNGCINFQLLLCVNLHVLVTMRQQLFNLAVLVRGQARQHILQISIWIMPIELGALNQAHHRSGALPGPQRPRKQPIVSADGNRSNLVLNPVVVDRKLPILQKPGQCIPSFQTVVQCFGRSRAVGDLLTLLKLKLSHGFIQDQTTALSHHCDD